MALALSALVMVLALKSCGSPPRGPSHDFETLVRELNGARVTAGRLWGAIAYRPYEAGRQSVSLDRLSPAALGALSRIAATSRQSASSEDLRVAADAELLLGNTDKAIALLLDALTRESSKAPLLNDLAAAYIASAAQGSSHALINALEAAAAAAELAPIASEPWFNLGIAASGLSLTAEARRGFSRAFALERYDDWKKEAGQRERTLSTRKDMWSTLSGRLPNVRDTALPEVSSIAVQFPQPVEEFLLDRMLPAWSQAFLDGETETSNTLAARARLLSKGLSRVAGDKLMVHCTDALTSAFHDGGDRAASLARAHLALARGRQWYEEDRRDEAAHAFESARKAFARGQSSCAEWVTVQIALARAQAGDSSGAIDLASRLKTEAETRGYVSLGARADWLAGLALIGAGRLEDALEAYRRAIAAYDRAQHAEHRLFLRGSAADALRLLGESQSGWSYLLPALQNLDDVIRLRRRYALFLNASIYAAEARLFRAARIFQDASLDLAYQRKVPNTIVEGLIARSTIELKLGRGDRALADLREAERLLPQISAPDVRAYQAAWLARSIGDVEVMGNPSGAIVRLRGVVDYFDRHEAAEVPAIFRSLGRAEATTGRVDDARKSFERGVAAFDKMWMGLAADQHRVSYLSESWDLFDDLVELHASVNPRGAFRYAEDARRRAIGQPDFLRPLPDLESVRIAAPRVLLYFATLQDRLLIWRLDSTRVELRSANIRRDALRESTTAFRRLIEAGAGRADIERLAIHLYRLLIETAAPFPDGATIVLVPDGDLPSVPFAALINPHTRRYLVEEHVLETTPSAQMFVRTQNRLAALAEAPRSAEILIVGNTRPADMPALPNAAQELRDVSSAYARANVIEGNEATPGTLARAAPAADIIHFAGHARTNTAFPWQSSLVLAPDPLHPSGLLTAAQITTWKLARPRLVVLSACQTAFGGTVRNPGLLGLARSFLLAGVPAVIGSLWDVDDGTTRALMRTFHRTFARDGDPGAALRAAQRSLIDSSTPDARLPRSWAAFLAVGS